jgi:hypothetical protein
VVFNFARLIGVLTDAGTDCSAAGCTSAACAAITRLLLLLVPQFAVPGSRTTRNHERNSWTAFPLRSSRTESTDFQVQTLENDVSELEDAEMSHLGDEKSIGQLDAKSEQWQKHTIDTMNTIGEHEVSMEQFQNDTMASEQHSSTDLGITAPVRFKLTISCGNLLDCDVFSKSDPYAVVKEGLKGNSRTDFAEIGKTEIIENDLNPVFKTAVEIWFREEEQQVVINPFDF